MELSLPSTQTTTSPFVTAVGHLGQAGESLPHADPITSVQWQLLCHLYLLLSFSKCHCARTLLYHMCAHGYSMHVHMVASHVCTQLHHACAVMRVDS